MSLVFNPLNHPILWTLPRRLTAFSAWHEHIPTAFLLVDLLKPDVLVELGTQAGDSYCAFCQAVYELGLVTRCFAIDTWQGDVHIGSYGPEVLADLRAYHDPLYGDFSTLIPSTFDEALAHFDNQTIDLLHIDGCHTYEAVSHDWAGWLPKLSARGVVLFHDIDEHRDNFGVWRLWEELKRQYRSVEFLYGHGLGILAVGRNQPPAFETLLNCSGEDLARISSYLFQLGSYMSLRATYQQELERLQHELTHSTTELARVNPELRWLRSQIRDMQATKIWRLGEAYWRIHAQIKNR